MATKAWVNKAHANFFGRSLAGTKVGVGWADAPPLNVETYRVPVEARGETRWLEGRREQIGGGLILATAVEVPGVEAADGRSTSVDPDDAIRIAALEALLGIRTPKPPKHIKARVAECRRRLALGESAEEIRLALGCTVDELISTLWRAAS